MRPATTALLAFYAVCALAVTGPGLSVVAADGQRWLGVPAALAWNLLWVVLSFAALALYHRAVGGGDDA